MYILAPNWELEERKNIPTIPRISSEKMFHNTRCITIQTFSKEDSNNSES
jgi:hypothetical protein